MTVCRPQLEASKAYHAAPRGCGMLYFWRRLACGNTLIGAGLLTAGASTAANGPADAAADVEAGEGAGKAPKPTCLVVHPDNAFACAARLSMEHKLVSSPSLASAWSASLSRGTSTKLEGGPSKTSMYLVTALGMSDLVACT